MIQRAFLVLALMVAIPAWAGETVLAEPRPSWDNPRRIVLQLTSDDVRHVNNVLTNAVNLQKFYGQDLVKVAVVAFGPGVRPFLREGSPVAERVASLNEYEVAFIACGNTLDAIGKTKADLLPSVDVVTAGIAEIVERQRTGWHIIAP